ncbi:Spx/MgsR family RNA polymerase-binding regulatory protein [Arenimonas composti]|uniref:Uncharacterized protein n=1 Tax=Arenimonas composti TR7-09 = DSM 18010 TaxID=1121013 RepID=A0A091BFX1_9GAMM|nr:Spx/MgsR family RNA polymerase-binding regulatory protein [Arenimonas composti]KFN49704.1 hypothetical protein P873_09105 [Arenimonas composti TR7-09 = DSM 18010]
MTIELYGLDTCDSCRKARNWLTRFGIDFRFVDLRAQRQAPETLKAWAAALGGWPALVNRQSTTWRQLPETRKSPGSDAEWLLLLKEYPALIKRPVLVDDQGVGVGFSDAAWKRRFGVGK